MRIIRNYIENLKFYPLLFHLKCLEKDPLLVKDKNKLKRILREEIASRGRFLYTGLYTTGERCASVGCQNL